jgi:hypothetical protein
MLYYVYYFASINPTVCTDILHVKSLQHVSAIRYYTHAFDLPAFSVAGNSTIHSPPKIVCINGFKQVASVTLGEKGINVTVIVECYW